jgi:hypothetical protein
MGFLVHVRHPLLSNLEARIWTRWFLRDSFLKGVRSTISKICEVTGSVGLSVGVIHRGDVIYQDHFGYRDVDKKIAPDIN